ncbi:HAD-IIIA family hydrolase [Burkholderiaceae bacterium DAT-1]|nr:HAD-IIIA family hydrolase [Burkholderiaceae bacterium DAT-1]
MIVFDWDGTLSDSTSLIVRSIQHAFAGAGLPVPPDEEAAHVIGYNLREALEYLAPGANPDHVSHALEAYKDYFLAHADEVVLFDGVREALSHFREEGYWLAVATGKSRRGLDRVMAEADLTHFFDFTRCGDECFSKPHPQMLEQLMEWTGVEARRTIMVGDTTHDLNMALNAKADALGVTYGAHPVEALHQCKPLAVLDRFTEVDAWLRANG